MNEPTQDPQGSGDHTFEVTLANQIGIIKSNLETILTRNPDLPKVVRARLAVIIGKCAPLATVDHLRLLRAAHDDSPVTLEVRFTEAPTPTSDTPTEDQERHTRTRS